MVSYVVLAISFVVVSITMFANPFNFSQEVRDTIVPWATLTLAIAAFWAIWQNYSFRRKDRKACSLDEIRSWAKASIELCYMVDRGNRGGPDMHLHSSYLRSEKNSVVRAAKIVNNDDLLLAVNNSVKILEEFTDTFGTNKVVACAETCKESFVEVLKSLSKVEVK